MIEGEFPGELFRLLEKKCGIRLPEEDFKERARRSGVGWACGHLGGGICFVFAYFISVLIFLMEGEFTWEKAFHDLTVNPMMHLMLVLVGIGLLCNLIFLPSAAWVYRKFRKTVRVSWMPILVDALILMLSIGGYEHFNGVTKAHEEEMRIQTQAEVMQEIEQRFICAFSRGVWGKEFSEVTAEEFASIKYIAADYGGAGQTAVRYSLVDYKDCASEQELDTVEGLGAIRKLKDKLRVLDITFKDGVDWSFYWHSEEFLDLSVLAEMTGLKELRVGFDGYFQVKGIEQLLSMAELKTFSLAGEWFGRETLVCLDETQMVENNSVEALSLSKCLMRDKEGEQLAEEFLTRFKGVKSLSLVGFEEIRESYDFLSEYKNLESLTVDRISLTEGQIQELEAWEEEIDVTYR